jgi:hypothetical protein
MARLTFPNTPEGRAAANAVADPKHIIERRADWIVLTGTDMPESLDPRSVVLNKQQFLYGLLTVGGQALLNAVYDYIIAINSTGTPAAENPLEPCQPVQASGWVHSPGACRCSGREDERRKQGRMGPSVHRR